MEILKLLTREAFADFKEEGGVGWWKLAKKRAENCEFVVCVRNTPSDISWHGTAFLIGKISGVTTRAHPEEDGRFRHLIRLSEYAHINIPDCWDGNQNPIVYTSLDQINLDIDRLKWHRFSNKWDVGPVKNEKSEFEQKERDIIAIREDESLSETERETLVNARLGQGLYRAQMIKKWEGRCRMTQCTIVEALRASHILAWSDTRSTNETRLDSNNGLLLAASVDALFDRHIISFTEEGELLYNKTSELKQSFKSLGIIEKSIGRLTPEQEFYMRKHRAIYRQRHG